MSTPWPSLPYEEWSATADTLHAYTQVLGKLAALLAPRTGASVAHPDETVTPFAELLARRTPRSRTTG